MLVCVLFVLFLELCTVSSCFVVCVLFYSVCLVWCCLLSDNMSYGLWRVAFHFVVVFVCDIVLAFFLLFS